MYSPLRVWFSLTYNIERECGSFCFGDIDYSREFLFVVEISNNLLVRFKVTFLL